MPPLDNKDYDAVVRIELGTDRVIRTLVTDDPEVVSKLLERYARLNPTFVASMRKALARIDLSEQVRPCSNG